MRLFKFSGFAALLAAVVAIGTAALADYTVTQGSGTTFGSAVVGSVHYAKHVLVDLTGTAFGTSSNPIYTSSTVTSSALPTGAATAAKQPAIGTAGSASADVISIQGVAGGTPQNVTPLIPQLTATDRGGTFGTSAAQLMPANASRHFVVIQVQSTTASCYINGSAAATADYHSLLIPFGNPVGGLYESVSHVGTGAISIICTGASTPVYAREG